MGDTTIAGVVLAAGAGRRMGAPKALLREADGTPWLHLACRLLHEAGCRRVVVVLGAAAEEAAALVPDGAEPVVAEGWREGVAASLRRALDHLEHSDAAAALITLVDTPAASGSAAARVIAAAGPHVAGSLARARYRGAPGHPVLIGRRHWTALRETLAGDVGAQPYLADNGVLLVDCDDIGGGEDRDEPASAPAADS